MSRPFDRGVTARQRPHGDNQPIAQAADPSPLTDADLKLVDDFWRRRAPELSAALDQFDWPGGLARREAVADAAQQSRLTRGFLSKETFDQILKWGFGSASKLKEADIAAATKEAFGLLADGDIAGALQRLQELPGIGVSRASKILALSDQENLGIYDSRAAGALASIQREGKPLVAIPPSRSKGVAAIPEVSQERLAREYPKYTAVLRRLLENAKREPRLAGKFRRVADIERALFSLKEGPSAAPSAVRAPVRTDAASRGVTRDAAGAALAGAAVGALSDLPELRKGKLRGREAVKRRLRDGLTAGGGSAAGSVAERFGKATSRPGALFQNGARGAAVGIVVGSINDAGALLRRELHPRDFVENRMVDAGEAGAGRVVQGAVMMSFAAAPFEAPVFAVAGSVLVVGVGVNRASRPVRRRIAQTQERRRQDRRHQEAEQ